ncbi:MAG: hypothetical protein IIZ92_07650, partial [Aquincola sp.]|nr:hypothetical protein [Aquincola sp.]
PHEQETEVDPRTLKATQSEFSLPKVQQALNYEVGDRAILVSSDGHVLDGHHQWLAAMSADKPVRVIRLNAPINELINQVREFPSAGTSEGATNGPGPAATGRPDEGSAGRGDQPGGSMEPARLLADQPGRSAGSGGASEAVPSARPDLAAGAGRADDAVAQAPKTLRERAQAMRERAAQRERAKVPEESQQDRSHREWRENYDRVVNEPDLSTVSTKDIERAESYGAQFAMREKRKGWDGGAVNEPLVSSIERDMEFLQAELARRRKAAGSTTNPKKADAPAPQPTTAPAAGEEAAPVAAPARAAEADVPRAGSAGVEADGLRARARRYEAGKALSKAARAAVLKTLTDTYKVKDAPRELKGMDADGNERYGYAHSPDLFEKSDITGAPIRYFVTLPDGRKAHPSELFPDYTQSQIDAEMQRREDAERAEQNSRQSRLRILDSRRADSLSEANRIFNRQNPGARDYVPATLTDGKQFVRTSPEAAEQDARLLGGEWRVQEAPQAAAPEQAESTQAEGNGVLQDLNRIGTVIASQGYAKTEVPRVQAARKLQGLIAKHEAGELSDGMFELSVKLLAQRMTEASDAKQANRLFSERERGADIVREKL